MKPTTCYHLSCKTFDEDFGTDRSRSLSTLDKSRLWFSPLRSRTLKRKLNLNRLRTRNCCQGRKMSPRVWNRNLNLNRNCFPKKQLLKVIQIALLHEPTGLSFQMVLTPSLLRVKLFPTLWMRKLTPLNRNVGNSIPFVAVPHRPNKVPRTNLQTSTIVSSNHTVEHAMKSIYECLLHSCMCYLHCIIWSLFGDRWKRSYYRRSYRRSYYSRSWYQT